MHATDTSLYNVLMYEIKHAGTKGLGVFANRLIPPGTRIFSERPLIALRQDQDASHLIKVSRLLSPRDRIELLKLSSAASTRLSSMRWIHTLWYHLKWFTTDIVKKRERGLVPKPTLESVKREYREAQKIVSIFRNNAFDFGPKNKIRQAVFANIARLNHSCAPNAQGNFDHPQGVFDVHATRAVQVGEEVTINYLPEHGSPRASRQHKLETGYDFECHCQTCDMSTAAGRDGEARRMQVHKDIATYGEQVTLSGVSNLDTELEITMDLIQVLEKDGISGRELATM